MIGNMLCVATLAMQEVEENRARKERPKSGTRGVSNERKLEAMSVLW